MGALKEVRKRFNKVIGPVLGVCIVGYFAYHATQGERGGNAWLGLKQKIAEAKVVEADILAERQLWERRVKLLRPESLDPDLLEERARVMLNYGRADETIIFTKD